MMKKSIIIVLGFFCLTIFSSPVEIFGNVLRGKTEEQQQPAWDEQVISDVQKIIQSHSMRVRELHRDQQQLNTQISWTTTSSEGDKPRAGQVEASVGNLMNVVQRISASNANEVSNHENMQTTYLSKKSELESKISIPQQQMQSRLEQREMCEKEERAMFEINDIVLNGVAQDKDISNVRFLQSTQYKEMTNAMSQLTEKNQRSATKILDLLANEIKIEKKTDGSSQYDSVTLRQKEPEDMLRHAKELTLNLLETLRTKTSHQIKSANEIMNIFSCTDCQDKSQRLSEVSSAIQSSSNLKKVECEALALSHRVLDEADREKILSLKKQFQDLETVHKLREDAEKILQVERVKAEQAARKMVGLYQVMPKKSST